MPGFPVGVFLLYMYIWGGGLPVGLMHFFFFFLSFFFAVLEFELNTLSHSTSPLLS
jgi:hypothetical protein